MSAMPSDDLLQNRALAVADFNRARWRAGLGDIIARLTGNANELLSYEDVLQQLKGRQLSGRKLEDIPLAAIVGSAGRYQEFTRGFLPRKYISSNRWVGIKLAMTGLTGVPPIEVYRIGEVYFVQDGNHRVSVARQMGMTTIQAYVTEVKTNVPLSRHVRAEDIVLAAEQTVFLECTQQKVLRPEADLRVTAPCQYPVLLEHIDVHRYFMGLEQQREIPYQEAFTHWYDTVYLPLALRIRERGLLRDFPGRTETDLYLWLCRHRVDLEKTLNWEISADATVSDLSHRFGNGRPAPNIALHRLQKVLTCGAAELAQQQSLEKQKKPDGREDHVVDDVLVALNGEPSGWHALDTGLRIAEREEARLHALHVVASEAERNDTRIQTLEAEFANRCAAVGLSNGKLVIAVGAVADSVCAHARWVDLVVTSLTQPSSKAARLSAGCRTLLRRCPRPVMAVPGPFQHLERALLAYDSSPKAEEALYVAAYLAGWWDVSLCIMTVSEHRQEAEEIQAFARNYLARRQVEAEFIHARGDIISAILRTAETQKSDLLIMGGHSLNPAFNLVLGSVVEGVLRTTRQHVLICQ